MVSTCFNSRDLLAKDLFGELHGLSLAGLDGLGSWCGRAGRRAAAHRSGGGETSWRVHGREAATGRGPRGRGSSGSQAVLSGSQDDLKRGWLVADEIKASATGQAAVRAMLESASQEGQAAKSMVLMLSSVVVSCSVDGIP